MDGMLCCLGIPLRTELYITPTPQNRIELQCISVDPCLQIVTAGGKLPYQRAHPLEVNINR